MESIYTDLALYDSKNLCARTDNVFLPISEVCNCTFSLNLTLELLAVYHPMGCKLGESG